MLVNREEKVVKIVFPFEFKLELIEVWNSDSPCKINPISQKIGWEVSNDSRPINETFKNSFVPSAIILLDCYYE